MATYLETSKVIIRVDTNEGGVVYLNDTYHNEISTTTDPQKAKTFDPADYPKVLDYIDRAFSRRNILKITGWNFEPMLLNVRIEHFVATNVEWQNAIRNRAINKLNGLEVRALDIEKHAVFQKCSDASSHR